MSFSSSIASSSIKLDYKCLIINLNPEDREMSNLTDSLIEKKSNNPTKNFEITKISWDALTDPKGTIFKSFSKERYDEISFVGHSRYYYDLKKLSVAERKLSGVSVPKAVDALAALVLQTHVSQVKFYCCEVACYEREDGVASNLADTPSEVDFTHRLSRQIEATAGGVEALEESQEHSTLEYFALKLLKKMSIYDDRIIRVTGLNGVGYLSSVDKSNTRPRSIVFDQRRHLARYNEIKADQERARAPRAIREAQKKLEQFEQDCAEGYTGPRKITLNVSAAAYEANEDSEGI